MRGSVRYEGVLHSRDYLLWGAVFAMRGCFVAGTICYEGQCLLWGESVMMNLSCTFSHRYSILPMTIDNDNWQWLWQWQWQLTIDNWQWQWNDNWQWQVTMSSANENDNWQSWQLPMTMPVSNDNANDNDNENGNANAQWQWQCDNGQCFQLDSADEQAAAIRRELDARREKVAEMERVRIN